jgi:hypothetical protein
MKISYLLPVDNFKLQTNLTIDEDKARLAYSIETSKLFGFSFFTEKNTKRY